MLYSKGTDHPEFESWHRREAITAAEDVKSERLMGCVGQDVGLGGHGLPPYACQKSSGVV